MFFHNQLEEPIVADILSVVLPFVVSLVLLEILFGLFPKYTRKFFPKRWDHIFGLVFGLALGLVILTFSWTLAAAIAPFITEQEALSRSRGVQLVRILSVPSKGFLNRLLPSDYQLPEDAIEVETPEEGESASRVLQLKDGTTIALPQPPAQEEKKRLSGTNSALVRDLRGQGNEVAAVEVQRIQEALDALLDKSGSAIDEAVSESVQEEVLSTLPEVRSLVPASAPTTTSPAEGADDLQALRRLNKLLEDAERGQGGGNTLVPTLPEFTREDLPQVGNPEAERHIQQLLQGLESLRSLQ